MNLLFLHIDALRFDYRTVAESYQKDIVLKGFDIVENEFSKVDRCYSSAVGTIYSVASYMTATYPFVNGVRMNDIGTVNPNIRYFHEILKNDYGWNTYCIMTSGPKHDISWNRIRLKEGFTEFRYLHDTRNSNEQQGTSIQMMKEISWMNKILTNNDNQFIHLVISDMHGRDGRDKDGVMQEYIEGMKRVDTFLNNMFRMVDLSNTIVIVFGDHGWCLPIDTELYNPYTKFNGMSLFEPLTRVGTYIKAPGMIKKTFNEQSSLVDLFPSAFHLLGYKSPDNINGSSIFFEEHHNVYAEFVESYVTRSSYKKILGEDHRYSEMFKEIPGPNYGYQNREWQLVVDAITDLPRGLYKIYPKADYTKNCVNYETYQVKELLKSLNNLYKEFKKEIRINEDIVLDNINYDFIKSAVEQRIYMHEKELLND